MTHIEIIDESVTQLSRKVWTFWYFDNRHALVLDGYREESRASRRARYKADAEYSRLRDRNSTITEQDAPLPEDVLVRARVKFNDSLRITKWDEVK